jgi:DNA-directed RNA polymerase subunit K/omega
MLMEKLTRFEITRLLSARALQLSLGAPPLVKTKDETEPIDIAQKELDEKILPLSVVRTFPSGETKRVEIS